MAEPQEREVTGMRPAQVHSIDTNSMALSSSRARFNEIGAIPALRLAGGDGLADGNQCSFLEVVLEHELALARCDDDAEWNVLFHGVDIVIKPERPFLRAIALCARASSRPRRELENRFRLSAFESEPGSFRSGRSERADHDVVAIRIAQGKLAGACTRIDVGFLFE